MKRIYAITLIFLFPLCLAAQDREIRGTVTDVADGNTLPGVNIIANSDGEQVGGTISDINGTYSISVPPDANQLTFVFIGMETVTEEIGSRTTINVALASNQEELDEFIVVGYGFAEKATLTGAVSSIENKEIQTATHSSLAQKLQGKVAGLNIRQNSGQPGSFDNSINIRGFGTPMFVIDGIIRNDPGAFQRINPDDIESISVLKDASAAVYGIGAANGVVIVTTKQGNRGKTSFTYNAVTGITRPTDVPQMATTAQYAQMRNDANIYGPGAGIPYYTRDELQKYLDGTLPGYTNVDWYDATMKNQAVQTQHNLSASGGGEKVLYYIGMEYVKDGGLLRSGDMDYNRVNLRSNITADLTKNLRARVMISGRYDKQSQPGDNFFNIFKTTRVTLPTERPFANDNPQYPGFVSSGFQTPTVLADRDLSGYTEVENRAIQTMAELRFAVPFVKDLFITGTGSFDTGNTMNKNLYKGFTTYTYTPATDTYNPLVQRADQNINARTDVGNTYTLRLSADYKTRIGQKHDISGTLVAEQIKGWSRWQFARRYYGDFYTSDQIRFAGQTNLQNDGQDNENSRISYIGRVNYGFSQKYLIEGAFNYNGSYRYHPDRRFGFFPVVSVGWRISEENFILNNFPAINELKLRGSYGVIGSDEGAPFQYLPGFTFGGVSTWEFSNNNLTNGLASPAITNSLLTWSTNHLSDIGFDLTMWNGKLEVVADFYNRERKGQLARRNISLPNTFGGTLPEENLNSSRQVGFEFALGHTNTINDFQYNVRGNFNFSRSMTRYQERAPFQSQRDRWLNGEAGRWGNRQTGYIVTGQFQSQEEVWQGPVYGGALGGTRELPGDFMYEDVNNDGIINGEDARTPLNYGGTPLINFGATFGAQWKGFDLNLHFQGAGKYTMRFNEVYGEMFAFRGNLPAYFFDRWHQADPYNLDSEWIPGEWPVTRLNSDVGMLYAESSVWRRNSSFVRLKSLELGYTFNAALLSRLGMERLRVYMNGFNLLTYARDPFMKQFDPEKVEGAFNAGYTYPLSKNYNLGLSLNF
ncbi:SusC/RagA family TonB-linked outer membrane protein [Cyclobacterium plantarum]|uniref:TonB-dependent receptor n=1 Tax=Cyclobacterium plantarum TaxID=2716263 RepID=A0ABX0HCQ4_9BACT|nr:TonB-dependent receptor [Cyclobacterium plantarum]NHE58703.1 TonB-dependent receptor [Cyclobacterium plantarum]